MWYDKSILFTYHYFKSILSLLYIYCLYCLLRSNLLKINQLLRNFPLILHVYFVSLKIISGHSFFIARMPFCQFPIKSKGLNRYLREYMREWELMSPWASLILILWFVSPFARMIWGQKIFLLMDMALYTIYKGHPGTAARA